MRKTGTGRDVGRRHRHVSQLQDVLIAEERRKEREARRKGRLVGDMGERKEKRQMPPADATWPTALVVAPSSVIGNWEREFDTVRVVIIRKPYGLIHSD